MLSKKFIEEYLYNNKSGKMSSVKYTTTHYLNDYNYIIEYSDIHGFDELPFKEKVFITYKNIKNIVTCENPDCENPRKIQKFKNRL